MIRSGTRQRSLLQGGKLHGYLRMYWSRRSWSGAPRPEEALAVAIRLNDRYGLDGRDPNGMPASPGAWGRA